MAIHMAESPIACMAAVHTAAAIQNVMAMEFHSVDVPWWNDLANGIANPLFKNGFVEVPNTPGLGIESPNEKLIAEPKIKNLNFILLGTEIIELICLN